LIRPGGALWSARLEVAAFDDLDASVAVCEVAAGLADPGGGSQYALGGSLVVITPARACTASKPTICCTASLG
jgi:hypothetical protein